MERIVKTGQIWRHWKGIEYRVDDVFVSARNCGVGEDFFPMCQALNEIHEGQETVMYSDDLGFCFFRSVEDFLAVEGSVTNFYRFERIA